MLPCVVFRYHALHYVGMRCILLACVAFCCHALHFVAMRCISLHSVAMCSFKANSQIYPPANESTRFLTVSQKIFALGRQYLNYIFVIQVNIIQLNTHMFTYKTIDHERILYFKFYMHVVVTFFFWKFVYMLTFTANDN